MDGTVHAVCAGRTTTMTSGGRTTRTAFLKAPIDGPVEIGVLGIATDEHVYEDHGGPDMALLVYPIEHYAHWRSLGLALPDAGAMAENLTVGGLVETDVHLGDVFDVGTAQVQVCQPRTPCSKIGIRFGRRNLPAMVQATGFTGYLLRVLRPGVMAAGDAMRLVERDDHGITVAEVARVVDVARDDIDAARRVLAVDALGASVRRSLRRRVERSEQLGLDLD